jgi:hypothetical protein
MTAPAARHEQHLAHYEEHGYVIVEGLLDPDVDLRPVVDEYAGVVDRLAKSWLEEGRITAYDCGQPLADRLLHLLDETEGSCFQHLDISLPLDNDIREDTPMHLGPAVFGLLRNPRLLDAVESFVGPEIYSNPVQHMRVKPPERDISEKGREQCLIVKTFWHQDQAVITEEADNSNVVSVWFPVMDVTEAHGCLVVVPGSHKKGLAHHCRTPNLNGIPEALVGDQRLPLPMKRGDVLFLNKLTYHASLPNVSDEVRWSFDVRYNPTGQPTGRPWFPGFVARSRAHPESEMADHQVWADAWRQTRVALADKERPSFFRWDPNDPRCA